MTILEQARIKIEQVQPFAERKNLNKSLIEFGIFMVAKPLFLQRTARQKFFPMIRSYFKTAWRTLARNKAFSAINISGLALGMTCFLIILLWVQDEKNVDAFHKNGSRLFQVYEREFL